MIPTEDNYIVWTVGDIKRYFQDVGYTVWDISIGQVKEHQFPVDRLLARGNKVIGFQFKRPESEGPPWRWKLRPGQHAKIVKSPWIWYCLPDFVEVGLQNVALHHCRFCPGNAGGENYITGKDLYLRWGSLAGKFMACSAGVEIGKEMSVDALLAEIAKDPQDAYLLLNRLAREAYLIAGDGPTDAEWESEPA